MHENGTLNATNQRKDVILLLSIISLRKNTEGGLSVLPLAARVIFVSMIWDARSLIESHTPG